MNDINTLKNIFLRASKSAGRDAKIELFSASAVSRSASWSDRKPEDYAISESEGIGLRIIRSGRMGFSFTSNFDDDSIGRMIGSADDNLKFIAPDAHFKIADPSPFNSSLDVFDETFGSMPADSIMKILREMEASALSGKKIKSVYRADYSESSGRTVIINSNGVSIISSGTVFSCGMTCTAEEAGEVQNGGEYSVKRKFSELDFAAVTREAVKNAAGLLGAKKIKTGNYPVVLNQGTGCEFLGIISSSFSAFAVQKNISLLKGRRNQKVFSGIMNIIDDGTLPGGAATSSFDDEGTPTARTTLVKNGTLENYLYDLYTAGVDGVKTTGNAARGYSGTPAPGTSNIFIAPGAISFKELLTGMGNGLYVTETMGMHNADPVTGEFSVGINGFMVENGEIKYPFHGVTAAGNIMELFNGVAGLADDLKFYGSTGSPSILISGVSVAGN